MKYYNYNIVLQEVPNEVSLSLSITGCQLGCDGCHSPFLWKDKGDHLTPGVLENIINKYTGMISCVLFLGGEWDEKELIELLKLSKKMGLKTCLYTGLDQVNSDILINLDYIKYGRWIKELGGLESKITNQLFIDLNDNSIINKYFHL